MRELHIISCIEDIPRFQWETIVQLHSARKYNLSNKFRIIIFLPVYNLLYGFSKKWKEIEKMFPEAKFFYYPDLKGTITDLIINYNYLPIHRLCSLEKHFKNFPELEKEAILYIDSDVIFTNHLNIEDYIQDGINYLSDVHTYMNEEYLTGKEKDVREEKKEEYKKLNIVDKAASFAKLSLDVIKNNNNNTGGAQYLLKNITYKFFSECIDLCLSLRIFFQTVNQEFFPGDAIEDREKNGIQSWCADMWSIQWNLWHNNLLSKTPDWMNFAWATDGVDKLKNVSLLHNAGIVDGDRIRITSNGNTIRDKDNKPIILDIPAFDKSKYKNTLVFSHIEEIEKIINHSESKKYCTSVYAEEILETYNNLIKNKKYE